jgi:hypothetical protein
MYGRDEKAEDIGVYTDHPERSGFDQKQPTCMAKGEVIGIDNATWSFIGHGKPSNNLGLLV